MKFLMTCVAELFNILRDMSSSCVPSLEKNVFCDEQNYILILLDRTYDSELATIKSYFMSVEQNFYDSYILLALLLSFGIL